MNRVINEEVIERAGTTRSLVNEIRKRQATFFGHVMRKQEMEHLVVTGKINGKRSRGRQSEKMLGNMTSWLHKVNATETISCTGNRERWRSMVTNAMQHGII